MIVIIKGELIWKIYLCILLPKCVYLFIQCTKNMFLINELLCISWILMLKKRQMSFPESLLQNCDVIRWNIPPVVIRDLRYSRY